MKRRELFQAFAALPVVASVKQLELGRDDAIVIECDDHLTQEHAYNIKAIVQAHFPGRKVLVLGGGLHVSVLRAR